MYSERAKGHLPLSNDKTSRSMQLRKERPTIVTIRHYEKKKRSTSVNKSVTTPMKGGLHCKEGVQDSDLAVQKVTLSINGSCGSLLNFQTISEISKSNCGSGPRSTLTRSTKVIPSGLEPSKERGLQINRSPRLQAQSLDPHNEYDRSTHMDHDRGSLA